jgi:hypothetical protein
MSTPELIERAKGPANADIQRGLCERLEQLFIDTRPVNRLLDDENLTPSELVGLIKPLLDEGIRDPKALLSRLRERDWLIDTNQFREFA